MSEVQKRPDKSQGLANERLVSFPQLNPNPVLEVDMDGRIVFANRAAHKYARYLGSRDSVSVFLPKDLKVIIDKARKNVENKFYREIQFGGKIFGENVHSAHEFKTLLIYAIDITKQRRAEEKLLKSNHDLEERVRQRTAELSLYNWQLNEVKRRYEELWNEAPIAYHILDRQGIIKQVNKTEARLLGYPCEEMIGRPVFDFILPEQRREAKRRFKFKLKGMVLPRKEERVYVKKDGTKIFVSIHDVLEKDKQGKNIGVRTTMSDITERVKMEEALRESNERLRRSQEQLLESYRHLGVINRKISLLLELEKQPDGRKKNEIIRFILRSAMGLAQAEAGMIFALDRKKNGKQFKFILQSGLTKAKQREARAITGKNCPLLRAALKNPIRYQGSPGNLHIACVPLAEKVKYILLLPLKKENKLEGVIILEFFKKMSMETQELEFFDIFAMQASLALINAGILK